MQISEIEVHPIKDYGDRASICRDADADFFGLFGLVEGDVNGFYIALGDFASRDTAELAKELLDNKKV
jgi:hypothetical protein